MRPHQFQMRPHQFPATRYRTQKPTRTILLRSRTLRTHSITSHTHSLHLHRCLTGRPKHRANGNIGNRQWLRNSPRWTNTRSGKSGTANPTCEWLEHAGSTRARLMATPGCPPATRLDGLLKVTRNEKELTSMISMVQSCTRTPSEFFLDLERDQVDIKAAFLNGDLEETIYLSSPEGSDIPANKILHLRKSLYGLKQSPHCFNKAFDKWLKSQGLTPSKPRPLSLLMPQGRRIPHALGSCR
jgi:hypothetical protein